MSASISELINLISGGFMDADDARPIVAAVDAARENPADYQAKYDVYGYTEESGMPLWQWVLIHLLPPDLLFCAPQLDDLYAQIWESFDDGLELDPDELSGLKTDKALKLIQQDLGPQFALASFGKPVSAEEPWQCVLVRSSEITQYLMLCNELQLRAEVCGR
ncbi:hypothetical protein [Chitinilyticum piscinae]|uniref:Uncharacterized protein n=1 Tax=Chitinilyticum piscinae TaxID=2866724 RepID=A0A8J7K8Q4_9NEIS|nr:hypothetical protein [Chitinilyticum piscinae]MBE9609913.1 hypothetical protein [Chitinilyticum piscinae]